MSGSADSPRSSTLELRRVGTRVLSAPWPFLYSVVPGRGLVKNLQSESAPAPVFRVRLPPRFW